MDEQRRTAFDAARETDLYRSDRGATAVDRKRARRQLWLVGVCTTVIAAAALAVLFLFEGRSPGSGEELEYGGLVYLPAEQETLTALGLVEPLDAGVCGVALTATEHGGSGDAALYRLADNETRALLVADRSGRRSLYQFAYFADPSAHDGRDLLETLLSSTALEGIDCVGSSGWEKRLTDPPSLAAFQERFAALQPAADSSARRRPLDADLSWDALIALRCENGLVFHMTVYKELKTISGFRCVYDAPEELLELIAQPEER